MKSAILQLSDLSYGCNKEQCDEVKKRLTTVFDNFVFYDNEERFSDLYIVIQSGALSNGYCSNRTMRIWDELIDFSFVFSNLVYDLVVRDLNIHVVFCDTMKSDDYNTVLELLVCDELAYSVENISYKDTIKVNGVSFYVGNTVSNADFWLIPQTRRSPKSYRNRVIRNGCLLDNPLAREPFQNLIIVDADKKVERKHLLADKKNEGFGGS